ncbi:MAG: hypothetical protein PF445_05285 [Melioribacteraceae bacterium]|jgi:DNA recombination protein RmuC|nr:hypothetical protein [Melioribacteraceae bacterium]
MTTEIGLIVGLITGLVISFLFTRALMKNKIEIAKATVENEKKEQFLILEKEKSQLEERVLKIGGLELDLSQNREELKIKVGENTQLEKRIAELETAIKKERESIVEKLELLENSKEDLKNEFKNLSNEILEEKSK